MAPQAYKVVRTHDYLISGWTILSRLLLYRATHLGVIKGDIQSNLATLMFKNEEELLDFRSIILRVKEEFMLSVENFSPTRLIFQYMKALLKSEKLRYLHCTKVGISHHIP